jgi:hypothetical protein
MQLNQPFFPDAERQAAWHEEAIAFGERLDAERCQIPAAASLSPEREVNATPLAPPSQPLPSIPTMARRLAPFVASGLVSFSEAQDTIMEHIVRYRWQELCGSSEQQLATEHYVAGILSREAEAASHG